jgi:hypothetical protein
MSYAQLAMDRKIGLGLGPAEPSGPTCATRPTSGLLEQTKRETTTSSIRNLTRLLPRIPFLSVVLPPSGSRFPYSLLFLELQAL